jgi:cbb3-type cytochrome oxidase subunit 3
MWLFRYVAYLDIVKSNISIAASTWETVTGRRRYIDLIFVVISSICYIVNIALLNQVAASEIRKSFFLLAVSLLSVLYAWWAWYGKRQRAHDFYAHKGHLRDLADVTIENTDVTAEEAEDAFIQFYVNINHFVPYLSHN